MKMELITKGQKDCENAMIYIEKDEYINKYEENKEKAINDMNILIEMFTAPECFDVEFETEEFEEIYNTLKTTTKYSGIVLVYIEYEDGEMGMDICYAK